MTKRAAHGGTTVLVEPDPGGHRFEAVANVAKLALRSGDVILLTSQGATDLELYKLFLADLPITVVERFDGIHPPTREMAAAIAEQARAGHVSTAVVMDADMSLKRWWYVAAKEFRGLERRPRVVFMLTRYIARMELFDRQAFFQRTSKAMLVLLAKATRTLDRAGGFAGRDDLSEGWVVKRLRDPAVCSAHARDRVALRDVLGLPQDRRIVGIIGSIDARKSVPLVYDAVKQSGADADLLVAGTLKPDVQAWVDEQPAGALDRMILMARYLDTDELDQLVAACDVVSVVQLNKGPSGIMGKALTAGVPVVTAGSRVRARELRVTQGGIAADMTAPSIADALRRLYVDGAAMIRADALPPATGETFAAALLGVDERGQLLS